MGSPLLLFIVYYWKLAISIDIEKIIDKKKKKIVCIDVLISKCLKSKCFSEPS